MMPSSHKPLTTCLLIAFILTAVWNFGILSTDGENEHYTSLFVKEKHTLKLFFHNPYDSVAVANDSHLVKWFDSQNRWIHGSEQFEDFSSYCWHRFGIADITSPELTQTCLKK